MFLLNTETAHRRRIAQLTTVRHMDLFFSLLTGKLYTLGILRTLNLRTRFRDNMASHDLGGRQSLSTFDWNTASTRVGSLDQTVSAICVRWAAIIQTRESLDLHQDV